MTNIVKRWMRMGLNMMNDMHFVINWTISCRPYGVQRNFGFVCRQEFHYIPQPAYRPSSLRDLAVLK